MDFQFFLSNTMRLILIYNAWNLIIYNCILNFIVTHTTFIYYRKNKIFPIPGTGMGTETKYDILILNLPFLGLSMTRKQTTSIKIKLQFEMFYSYFLKSWRQWFLDSIFVNHFFFQIFQNPRGDLETFKFYKKI